MGIESKGGRGSQDRHLYPNGQRNALEEGIVTSSQKGAGPPLFLAKS
jgi:hypothetical protein